MSHPLRAAALNVMLLGAATAVLAPSALAQDQAAEAQPDTAPPAEAPAPAAPFAAFPAHYHNHDALSAWARRLADQFDACSLEPIGTSLEGRELWALTLALPGDVDPAERSAILLAANLDGDLLVGAETAMRIAEALLIKAGEGDEQATALLTDHTVYVVPRVNPDAAERSFAGVRQDRRRNFRPDDADRDARIDEDPPDDLNGDGLITLMRVFDPEKADAMADPNEPRLNTSPERDKGERAEFVVYPEGLDDDGDGQYNEDDLGGVDLNFNFMHRYQEHADGAGPYPVSEPESLSLLKWTLDRQNIAVALVFGRHDTLSKPPKDDGREAWGAPKGIEKDDVGLYEFISERFKEITGLKEAPSSGPEGAFWSWAYAQYGIPAFSTPLWNRPEIEKEKGKGDARPDGETGGEEGQADAGEALTPSGIGDISQQTIDELRSLAEEAGVQVTDEMIANLTREQVEQYAAMHGVEVRRVKAEEEPEDAPKGKREGKPRDENEAKWLAYSDDQRGGEGFVPWQDFDHPQLGRVQIGGWAPYFKTNPPADQLNAIAEKQYAFLLDLGSRLPVVQLTEPEITRLAPGLYEIKAALVNDGYFPTGTAMAQRNRRARPHVVRLSVANEQVVAGQRISKIWSIPGSGGREDFRWIVRADDGSELTITVHSEKYGGFERTVTLAE